MNKFAYELGVALALEKCAFFSLPITVGGGAIAGAMLANKGERNRGAARGALTGAGGSLGAGLGLLAGTATGGGLGMLMGGQPPGIGPDAGNNAALLKFLIPALLGAGVGTIGGAGVGAYLGNKIVGPAPHNPDDEDTRQGVVK